jgi:acetyl-CoA/propionyl-CoA carboxylase carboxyl transferase subunit
VERAALSDAPVLAPLAVRRDALVWLAALFDPGMLSVTHPPRGEEVVTAYGRIDGARVAAYSTEASKLGGAVGSVRCGRFVETIDTAQRMRAPVIGSGTQVARG